MAERKRSTSSPIFIGNCMVEIDGGSVRCESIVKGIVLSVKKEARIRISEWDSKKETFRGYYSKRRFRDCSQDEGTRTPNYVDHSFVHLNPKDVDSRSKIASEGGGEEPPHKSFTSSFFPRKKLVNSGHSHQQNEPDKSPDPVQTRDPSPSIHITTTNHVPSYHSLDNTHTTPIYPYTTPPYAAPPPGQTSSATSAYPPNQYSPQPCYDNPNLPPPPPHFIGPSTSTNSQGACDIDSRMLIEPNGDTFNPSKQPTQKIQDIIRSMFDAPYMSWKKIPQGVRDMWFLEFEKDFRWLPQHYSRIKKIFEKQGSTRLYYMFIDIRRSGQRPLWIREDVWSDLCDAWGTQESAQRMTHNKQNRASDSGELETLLHNECSFPHAEHKKKLKQSLDREPTLLELHTPTHQHQESQDWVTPNAQKMHDNHIQLSQSRPSIGEESLDRSSQQSKFDLCAQTVGGVQKGRFYRLGSRAKGYGSSSYLYDVPRHEVDEMSKRVLALSKEMNARIASMESQLSGMKARIDRMEESDDDEVTDDKP